MSKLDTFLPIHVFMSICGSDGPTRILFHLVRKLVLGTWPWGHSAAGARAGIGVAVAVPCCSTGHGLCRAGSELGHTGETTIDLAFRKNDPTGKSQLCWGNNDFINNYN